MQKNSREGEAMSDPKKPEEIRKRTFAFALRIVRLCKYLDEKRGVCRTLGNQLIRSGTSVGANVEEAKASHSRADFIYKLEIALKESRETVYWLRLVEASTLVTSARINELLAESIEISRVLGAIIVSTRRNSR
jgi:four helix bundle protein